jgi:cation transport protein ChaC
MAESDRWVFAYGSLMWRPEPYFEEQARAQLLDHRRAFCVYAVHNRGTPLRRGLVLGVVSQPGEHVEGIAYRISGDRWSEAYRSLVAREQGGQAYCERWLKINLNNGTTARALVFVADRRSPTWAGNLTITERLALISSAVGKMGSNADYLLEFERQLGFLGIVDADISDLARQLRELIDRRSVEPNSIATQDLSHEDTV